MNHVRLESILQEYDFLIIVHTQGISNPSDFLSRHPIQDTSRHQKNISSCNSKGNVTDRDRGPAATKEDNTLQKLADLIHKDKWDLRNCQNNETGMNKAELRQFYKVRHDLMVNSEVNVILKELGSSCR